MLLAEGHMQKYASEVSSSAGAASAQTEQEYASEVRRSAGAASAQTELEPSRRMTPLLDHLSNGSRRSTNTSKFSSYSRKVIKQEKKMRRIEREQAQ